MTRVADPQVKGSAFLSVRRSLGELRGADAVDAAIQAASDDVSQALRHRGIAATGTGSVADVRCDEP
jgi:hypothetical protein